MMHKLKHIVSKTDLVTPTVLRLAAEAEAKLGELRGYVHIVPNEAILLSTLPFQEARASSEIENIVTTADDLFRARVNDEPADQNVKEVQAHADALLYGWKHVRNSKILRLDDLLNIQKRLIGNNAGLRTQLGTTVKNNMTGETVYIPPAPEQLPELMSDLVAFINDANFSHLNPLVKMAVIHHQFESIHPFYDGNGRTGRILNQLYLVLHEKLDLPVLYLSRYIIATKPEYYRLLQTVRDENAWGEWLHYILNGITETATQTIHLIRQINELLLDLKHRIRTKYPRHYSQDLINALFKYPYTKIGFLQTDLACSYHTARTKLKILTKAGFLKEIQAGRDNYYLNHELLELLMGVHGPADSE